MEGGLHQEWVTRTLPFLARSAREKIPLSVERTPASGLMDHVPEEEGITAAEV